MPSTMLFILPLISHPVVIMIISKRIYCIFSVRLVYETTQNYVLLVLDNFNRYIFSQSIFDVLSNISSKRYDIIPEQNHPITKNVIGLGNYLNYSIDWRKPCLFVPTISRP